MLARKCVALLSGGLDSRLAIRLMLDQGIEVDALNFRTQFSCCKENAAAAARELGVRLTVLSQGSDYLDLIKNPRYGHGAGMNPCVDCRIHMFQVARAFMDRVGASFVVSGEVLGQRPMSQQRRQLEAIERDSGLEDLLLRPLSAHLLPETLPEREGIVDRARLLEVQGRSRRFLQDLGEEYGIMEEEKTPSSGCALTEKGFAKKVRDLIYYHPRAGTWDFELLKHGRTFRLDSQTRVVLGKDEEDNLVLDQLFQEAPEGAATRFECGNFEGPVALMVGPFARETAHTVAMLMARYSNKAPAEATVLYDSPAQEGELTVTERLSEEAIRAMNPVLGDEKGAHKVKKGVILHG